MKGFKQHPKMSHGGHYCWGGKVMKKAEGGSVKKDDIELEEMPSGAKQYIRGKSRADKDDTIRKYESQAIDEMQPGSKDFIKQAKKTGKIQDARIDNLEAWKRGGKVKPFWETKSPKKESKKLTPSQKASAKARAAKAGRPYPNLIDNAAAARRGK